MLNRLLNQSPSFLLLVFVASFGVAACGTAVSGEGDDDSDAAIDGAEEDALSDADPDGGADAPSDTNADADDDTSTDTGVCSTQGCACEASSDCDSGYCLQDGQGARYCADECTRDCSTADYRCIEFLGDDTPESEPVFLCVLQEYPYCGACESDDDCAGFGVCAEQSDGSFCAPFCGADDPCPSGSQCVELDGAGSAPVCAPTLMQCADCIDPDEDGYGTGLGCLGADCNEEDPSVNAGSAELCDGLDNDCDDRVDEDFNLTNDPNNCRACGNVCEANNGTSECRMGACVVTSCDDGFDDCNGDGEDGCETDLNAATFCGVCEAGADRPGDLCGTCESGAFACQEDGSIACEGDLGDAARNACGGCVELPAELGSVCEDTGTWECDGLDALRCIVRGEVVVTTTEDSLAEDGLCSLRELIIAANTGVEVDSCGVATAIDVVRFSQADATYMLTIPGGDEDAAATGDLDVLVPLTFEANGSTVIDAASIDRIFDVHAEGSLTLTGLTLRNGVVNGAHGGAIRALGPLSAMGCSFESNVSTGGAGQQDPGATGGGGGGGGAGLGGAIYAEGVEVTLQSGAAACVFLGNGAVGGAGANGVANGGSFSGVGGPGGGPNPGAGGSGGAGGDAGFGGGGGGGANASGTAGGAGGFAGGGGGGGANAGGGATGPGGSAGAQGGTGGTGCCSASAGGGGGAGLGSAVFINGGNLTITGCEFRANDASGGSAGTNHFGGGTAPLAGEGRAAIYVRDATASIDATYEGNTASTGDPDEFSGAE